MLLISEDMPIVLETLNMEGNPLSETRANLIRLDSEQALLQLSDQIPNASLRWGMPVRFKVEQECKRYEIVGVVIGWKRDSSDAILGENDLHIRIWDCLLADQRRVSVRRKGRFTALLRPEQGDELIGWCIDFGAGGIRVRIPKTDILGDNFEIEFTPGVNLGDCPSRTFKLPAKVLRREVYGKHADQLEVALGFTSLSVEDGMALTALLR